MLEILVPGLAALISFIIYWSYYFYYKPIKLDRIDVLKKLKSKFIEEIKKYDNKKLSDNELVKNINLNMRFQNILENSGKLLEYNMFISGIAIVLVSLLFAIIYPIDAFVSIVLTFYLITIPAFFFTMGLYDLIKVRGMIDKYKKGIQLINILPKRTRITIENRN